jgi:hypothetical protein
VADSIGGDEIGVGGLRGLGGGQIVDLLSGARGEEDGAGLGVENLDVANAVVLFVRPGEFVFFDDSVQIILTASRGDQTGLPVLSHDLAVEVKERLRVLLQRPVGDEPGKVFAPFGVHLRRVGIDLVGQIDFRLADVEEAEGFAASDLAALGGGHHVVGQFTKLAGDLMSRTECGERFNMSHVRRIEQKVESRKQKSEGGNDRQSDAQITILLYSLTNYFYTLILITDENSNRKNAGRDRHAYAGVSRKA